MADFDIMSELLIDNGDHFFSTFFAAVCSVLTANSTNTTKYHPQTDVQMVRRNSTIESRLRNCVSQYETHFAT